MSTLTIRLPDTKYQRLKAFARTRGVSLNKLIEEWARWSWHSWMPKTAFGCGRSAAGPRPAWRC